MLLLELCCGRNHVTRRKVAEAAEATAAAAGTGSSGNNILARVFPISFAMERLLLAGA